ncbi:hypothetical protein NC652_038664 [Populus alba x Populus x berolinensis]|nr:hypothetical protein NC652_038664 [Populus alba x Populus x berolinensis]
MYRHGSPIQLTDNCHYKDHYSIETHFVTTTTLEINVNFDVDSLLQCHKHQPRRNQLDHLVLEDG